MSLPAAQHYQKTKKHSFLESKPAAQHYQKTKSQQITKHEWISGTSKSSLPKLRLQEEAVLRTTRHDSGSDQKNWSAETRMKSLPVFAFLWLSCESGHCRGIRRWIARPFLRKARKGEFATDKRPRGDEGDGRVQTTSTGGLSGKG